MAFRWRADDGPLIVATPHKQNKKNPSKLYPLWQNLLDPRMRGLLFFRNNIELFKSYPSSSPAALSSSLLDGSDDTILPYSWKIPSLEKHSFTKSEVSNGRIHYTDDLAEFCDSVINLIPTDAEIRAGKWSTDRWIQPQRERERERERERGREREREREWERERERGGAIYFWDNSPCRIWMQTKKQKKRVFPHPDFTKVLSRTNNRAIISCILYILLYRKPAYERMMVNIP